MPSPCPKFLGNPRLPKTQIMLYQRPCQTSRFGHCTARRGFVCLLLQLIRALGCQKAQSGGEGTAVIPQTPRLGGMRWELWFSGSFPRKGQRGMQWGFCQKNLRSDHVMSKELREIRGLSAGLVWGPFPAHV